MRSFLLLLCLALQLLGAADFVPLAPRAAMRAGCCCCAHAHACANGASHHCTCGHPRPAPRANGGCTLACGHCRTVPVTLASNDRNPSERPVGPTAPAPLRRFSRPEREPGRPGFAGSEPCPPPPRG